MFSNVWFDHGDTSPKYTEFDLVGMVRYRVNNYRLFKTDFIFENKLFSISKKRYLVNYGPRPCIVFVICCKFLVHH